MILAVVLVLIGLGLVLAEVFFPSLGMFGLMAGACIIFADVIAFEAGTAVGWSFIAAEVILIPFIIHMGFKVLPSLPFGKRMMLDGPTNPPGAGLPDLSYLINTTGSAQTDLRPAGTGRFGDERVSVVSLGGMIDQGTPIVVVAVEGADVRVRPVAQEHTSTETRSD